jgi:hypothetical protein
VCCFKAYSSFGPWEEKTAEASRHFLDVKEDTAGMVDSIKKPKRVYPYILQIGDSFTIIAEGKPFVTAKSSSEALLSLFSLQYAFNLEYSTEVRPFFLLTQSEVASR